MRDVWCVGSAACPYPPNDAESQNQRETECDALQASSAALQPRSLHALQYALRHKRLLGRQHVMLVRSYATEVRRHVPNAKNGVSHEALP